MTDLLPDISDEHGELLRWIPQQWLDYGGNPTFHGRVVTLRCFEDNTKVREILSGPGEGRVLFIDGHGNLNKALLGDQLAELAVKNGWQGIIVNGAVRDVSALSMMDLGVKALGACPIKTEKRGAGEQDVPLRIAGILVAPGDYLYADLNGVMLSEHPVELGGAD
ncbi:ribonuclease activity regulator protein RraA [Veronia nyctiphanis]|uniref:4-hydroxy-4-methyl-2-oxoglutarate aldolase n=1 Tax=Veronia nyctiphanis TaxID=1278244 RepID=A0A4V1LT30_9GAMM|nr:putative 4-hydroxy-4-methyl-2-oxoglutarate aldolase [Veronia nyctiphanis]RXJ73768.1 ribonuclease activity regulator protein RraA [Veronia nyctiphanis]